MRKNKHAVALGRKGGEETARRLTKEQRIASAQHAANARWQAIRTDTHKTCQQDGNGENK